MTIDEATEKCGMLEKLNVDIWNASSALEKNELKDKFRKCWMDLIANGFKVTKIREYSYSPVAKLTIKYKAKIDKTANNVEVKNNRGEGNHHGDCTTRAISFCTGVDYSTIQKEQMANAKEFNAYGVTWRTERIWSKSLTSRGFCKISLPKKMTGNILLKKLEGCGINDGIIAGKSAHHLAAIDMKSRKILDTWNSSKCRLMTLYVPVSQKNEWMVTIERIFKR